MSAQTHSFSDDQLIDYGLLMCSLCSYLGLGLMSARLAILGGVGAPPRTYLTCFSFSCFSVFRFSSQPVVPPPTPARQINKPLSNLLITHCKINSLLASCCCGLTAARSCSSDPLCCRAVYVHAGVAVSVAVSHSGVLLGPF